MNRIHRKTKTFAIIAVMLAWSVGVQDTSGYWVWQTQQTFNWTGSHFYSESTQGGGHASHSGTTIDLEAQTSSWNDIQTATSHYETDEDGSSSAYVVQSSGYYRVKVTYRLNGVIDPSAGGDDYSYLRVTIGFYDWSPWHKPGAGSNSYIHYSGSFSHSLYAITSSDYPMDIGDIIHVFAYLYLVAKAHWRELTIDNDFHDGSRYIELETYQIQKYVNL